MKTRAEDPAYHPADKPISMTLYPAPSGLVAFRIVTQGVALGWYVAPLQGLHEPWRKLFQPPDTEVRRNENDPAEPRAKPSGSKRVV